MNRRAKLLVISTFGSLTLFYVTSVAATVIRVGPSEIAETAVRRPEFVVLLVARVVEAMGCLAIVVLSFGSGPRLAVCVPLAGILAVGAVVLLIGLSARSPAPGLWAMALVGIALHLSGAFWAWSRWRSEAF